MKKILIGLLALVLVVNVAAQNEWKYVSYFYGGAKFGTEARIASMAPIDSALVVGQMLTIYSGATPYYAFADASGYLASINQDLGNTDSPAFNALTLTGTSTLGLGTYSTSTGQILFKNSTNANDVTLQAGATTAPYTLTLPLDDGDASQFLQTNGSGVLDWATGSGGSSVITDLTGTAWRVVYVDGSGDVTELALGTDGQVLTSTGASTAPAFEALSGGGDMSFTDTTAMLAPYPDFTEMRGEISDSLDALLAAGQAGVVLADSTGVAAGTYVTGWDFVAGQALKADLASPTFTGVVTLPSPFTIGSTSMTATAAQLNYVDATSSIQTQLNAKAPLASPTFTGTVSGAAITATGNITGAMATTLYTAATESLTAQECRNQGHVNNDADAIDFTLPTAEAGLVVIFYDFGGGVITVDAAAGDVITLSGTALDAGDAIDSPGDVGDFIALWAIDATNWVSVGASGTWVDGGTD